VTLWLCALVWCLLCILVSSTGNSGELCESLLQRELCLSEQRAVAVLLIAEHLSKYCEVFRVMTCTRMGRTLRGHSDCKCEMLSNCLRNTTYSSYCGGPLFSATVLA